MFKALINFQTIKLELLTYKNKLNVLSRKLNKIRLLVEIEYKLNRKRKWGLPKDGVWVDWFSCE